MKPVCPGDLLCDIDAGKVYMVILGGLHEMSVDRKCNVLPMQEAVGLTRLEEDGEPVTEADI